MVGPDWADVMQAECSRNGSWRRVLRVAARWLRLPAIAYLLVVLTMTFLETWLVYPIPPRQRGDWEPAGLAREEVWFAAADGTRIHAWYVPHPRPRVGLVYCHGNGEHVADNADLVARLQHQLEASVLIFDYRGYGRSEGRPHEAGLVSDGLAAQQWLASRMGLNPSDLVIMGRSIGGAVAVAMAAELDARALILVNTFSRLTDAAARHYPWLPVRLLMRNRFDSIDRIRSYRGPLLQTHGAADQIVPIALGRQLFSAAPGKRKQFIEHPGRGHNDPPPDHFYQQLAEFLERMDASEIIPGREER